MQSKFPVRNSGVPVIPIENRKPANLWSPSGDCHIGLTSGHTFLVPGDKTGAEVPYMFRRVAIARGCLPVGMEPVNTKSEAFEQAVVSRGCAKRGVAHAQAQDEPTHQPVAHGPAAADPEAAARETMDKATAVDHTVDATLHDRTADAIMRRLQQVGDTGLTRTEISAVFKRNLSAERIGAALKLLHSEGRAIYETISTEGRSSEVWRTFK